MRTPVVRPTAAAPAPASTVRRLTPRFMDPPLPPDRRIVFPYRARHCGFARRRIASPARIRRLPSSAVNRGRIGRKASGVKMPYDVTIVTVKPNRHMDALKGIEPWLKANPRRGEFL